MKLQVSFDFDGVLSIPEVEEFAKELIEDGINVWVTTSRYNEGSNLDLLKVTDRLGIPYSNIQFTGRQDKSKFLEQDFFLFHLDDEPYVINEIIENGQNTTPILMDKSVNWEEMCKELIDFSLAMQFIAFRFVDVEPEESLEELLAKAIEEEDYEYAAVLRDEIKSLDE
tara:strand:+ start:5711 stop:6217 length:507 start_codon:yes stop_codon:yes gene_type:complete